jgi:hypothetical protein
VEADRDGEELFAMSIPIAVTQLFSQLEQQSETLCGAACEQLSSLAAQLSSWHAKRERLDLIRSAPDSTLGVLHDVADMRQLLALAYVERCRTAYAAVSLLDAQCAATLQQCTELQGELLAAVDRHLQSASLTAGACLRNDGAPSLAERIAATERRLASVRGMCCVVAELHLSTRLSVDSSMAVLNDALQRVDRATLRSL